MNHFSAQIRTYGMLLNLLEAIKNWKVMIDGNIELRNVVERMLILGGNPVSKKDIENFVKK